jgi:hypothetical protein
MGRFLLIDNSASVPASRVDTELIPQGSLRVLYLSTLSSKMPTCHIIGINRER